MIWNGPGIVPRRTPCEAYVSLGDVLPTICGMLGLEVPRGVQGRNLWPLLSGEGSCEEFRSMYVEKGVEGRPYGPEDDPPLYGGNFTLRTKTGAETFAELNDVTDPHELVNLAYEARYRDKKEELMEEMVRWDVHVGDLLPLKGYKPAREV